MNKVILSFLVLGTCLSAHGAQPATPAINNSPASAPASQDPEDKLKLIHVNDLNILLETQKKSTFVFDANNQETREKEGIIPGAKVLSSYDSYDVAKELPKDKNANLVFYCANTMCKASHSAAQRAEKAGYKNVSVMADGIQGWKKAGQKSEKIKSS